MFVVWINYHFYHPYTTISAYLYLDNESENYYNWTLDKNQATKFADIREANQYKIFLEDESNKQSRILFDIILGIERIDVR